MTNINSFAEKLLVQLKADMININEGDKPDVLNYMREIHRMIYGRLRELNLCVLKNKYALEKVLQKVAESDWRKSKFGLAISHIRTQIYRMERAIEDGLHIVNDIMKIRGYVDTFVMVAKCLGMG